MSVILLVEDNGAILRGLRDSLRFEGYEVFSAMDGETGYRLALEKKPDLVLLDLRLPKLDGFEVCRKLRGGGFAAPIVMLTACGEEADRVRGLDFGADDYVTKPFSMLELLARVRARLRRLDKDKVDKAAALPDSVRFDDVAVDFRRFDARRSGVEIKMTPKEFEILRFLASKDGEVCRREELLIGVWGYENIPDAIHTINVHIAGLRAKLEENPAAPRRIITVYRVGYKLVVRDGCN